MNSINKNGISVCQAGEENYTTFVAGAFRGTLYYQYDYRNTDGELFTTVAPTLEKCRKKQDKWLNQKLNFKYKKWLCEWHEDEQLYYLYIPSELEQPNDFRHQEMEVSTVEQAKEFINHY